MTEAKDEIVKKEILTHAQKLFNQYGVKKTTMDEIAASCGKAKSTLYHYFKSKNDVFSAVLEMEFRDVREAVTVAVSGKSTLVDKITIYFRTFHVEALKRNNLYRIIKQEQSALGIDIDEYFYDVVREELKYTSKLMNAGIRSGELSQVPVEEVENFSEILLAGFLGIVRYSVETENGLDLEKLDSALQYYLPRVLQ